VNGRVRSSAQQKEVATMEFAMLTYVSKPGAEAWEQMTDAERRASVEEHEAWFARHRASITGGHHLAWPRRWGRIADRHQLTIHDGPFAETKEALGGVILLTADTLEEALDIARTWPALDDDLGAAVEVIPLGGSE
jgi:hypothetical protein